MTARLFATAALVLVSLGSSSWAATYHVAQKATGASDQNAGTEQAPLKTIGAALKVAKPGDTILVGAGTYREECVWPGEDWKNPEVRMTLAAAPGARPVIKGSEVVPGPWQRAEVKLSAPPAAPAAIYACAWEPYSQMVFVDEAPLKQIGLQGSPARAAGKNGFQYQKQWDGKTVEDMRPGSFFTDAQAKRLYVWLADGGDPAKHVVEASVRSDGFILHGTWTVRGLDVRHFQDHFWPHEQATAVSGNRAIVEDCHITYNDFLGLIFSGEDGIIRNCEFGYNGLEGITSNVGYRMLIEGNDFHHNGWRGDVVCLTYGNKLVMWRDTRVLRNRWHDEPAAALWFDISNGNILIAENTFDNCSCGIYFEISRWGIIANNVFRHCGRGAWIYSSDVLVANNILDGCGEGITVTGFPRTGMYAQKVDETPLKDCLMAVRNVQMIDNILIDCPGCYIEITDGTPYGWGNWSDYNAFVWTLVPFHRTGDHIKFANSWDSFYGKLPIWRMVRHCDLHSVVVDPGLLSEIRVANPYVGLAGKDVFADAKFVNRDGGDYRLAPDSPLIGKGVAIPAELNSVCAPCPGNQVLTREWSATRLADAPDPATATPVFGTKEDGHYRLQPLPRLHALVDLDDIQPGTPGLNEQWRKSGQYPRFKTTGEPDTAAPNDFVLLPNNLLTDPGFDKPLGKPGDAAASWTGTGGMHTFLGTLCVNLLPSQRTNALTYQKVGTLRANAEYLLCGDLCVQSVSKDYAGLGEMGLAAGDPTRAIGKPLSIRANPMKGGSWNTYDVQVRTGAAGADPNVGQDLFVVIAARVEGPEGGNVGEPAFFARWDDLWLLSSPPAR